MLHIEHLSPSDAREAIAVPNSPLMQLILQGYDLRPDARLDRIMCAQEEYDYDDHEGVVLLAKEDNVVLGSLILLSWSHDVEKSYSQPFWREFAARDRERAWRLRHDPGSVLEVGGVVIDPRARQRSIGWFLLKYAAETLQPWALLGQTKTVGAVLLRRKLVELGYRTFYGWTEVTPGYEQLTTDVHLNIVRSYYAGRELGSLNAQLTHVFPGDIAPTLPDTRQAPEIVHHAFAPVIATQQQAGESVTIMSPLICLHNRFLDPTDAILRR